MLEFRHLQYFIAVAEELHFGRAAERLNISQPPLSKQIIQLEENLGVKLFNRTKRYVELTTAGKFFLEESYNILASIEKLKYDTLKIHKGQLGHLSIGFAGPLSSFLISLFRAYQAKYPESKLILHQIYSMEQIKALQDKQIHLGFLVPPDDINSLNFRIIASNPFVVALPETHPLASQKGTIDLIALKNDPFILSSRRVGPTYFDRIISTCLEAGFSPKISQEADGVLNILSLIAANMGVSIFSKSILEHKVSGVVFKSIRNSTIKSNYSVAWRKDENSGLVNNFLELLETMIENKVNN